MIEPTTLARPYARAAFEHARAAGDLAAWQTALTELAAITAEPKVAAAMRDPNQTATQRASTLSGLAGEAAPPAVANPRSRLCVTAVCMHRSPGAGMPAAHVPSRAAASCTAQAELSGALPHHPWPLA